MPLLDLPRFIVDIQPDRSRVRVAVRGELDVATVAEVQRAIDELRDAGWDDIVVDVADMSFIDSAGLAVLIAADRRAGREGWRLTVANGRGALDRLMELSGPWTALPRA